MKFLDLYYLKVTISSVPMLFNKLSHVYFSERETSVKFPLTLNRSFNYRLLSEEGCQAACSVLTREAREQVNNRKREISFLVKCGHFDARRRMIRIESEHFRVNRILLLVVGLWPYQRSKLLQFQSLLLFGILSTFIIFQFSSFMISECTLDLVIKIFSCTFIFVSCAITFNMFWYKAEAVKYLLEHLQRICNNLRDENEIAIMEEYGNKAKRYTNGLTLFVVCCLFLAIFLQISPHILDVILPMNKSRSYRLPIVTEYFFDEEKYFYLIVVHMNIAGGIGAISMLATGLMIEAYFQHACGMFKIASYRIEQIMAISILQNVSLKSDNIIHKQIIYAVDIHRKALEFSEFILSNFEGYVFFLIITKVICLSLNLFRVFQLLLTREDIEEFMLHCIFAIISLLYMFLANYAGQEITDHSNQVFVTAYNIQWYKTPPHIQRLLLFLLQRGSKIFILNLGGLFVASLENFATLISTSVSYFTVLYSMQ